MLIMSIHDRNPMHTLALPHLIAIRFSGADAGTFLHSQLSADILGLETNASTFACYCEPKGRVLALMLVCHGDEDYFVIMSRELAAAVTNRLNIYKMRSKVSIDTLDNFTVAVVAQDTSLPAPESCLAMVPLPNHGESLAITSETLASATTTELLNAWKVTELQRGISWLGEATTGQFLPQMLGFDDLGAVNYRKGCYPGQEIVARTHYLGKVKRHPRLLCTATALRPKPLEKIDIHGSEGAHQAVVADYASTPGGGSCLLVITRMDPELEAEKIEYQGQLTDLV